MKTMKNVYGKRSYSSGSTKSSKQSDTIFNRHPSVVTSDIALATGYIIIFSSLFNKLAKADGEEEEEHDTQILDYESESPSDGATKHPTLPAPVEQPPPSRAQSKTPQVVSQKEEPISSQNGSQASCGTPKAVRSNSMPRNSQPSPLLRKFKSEADSSRPAKAVRFTYESPAARTKLEEASASPQCALEAFESRESGKSLQVADDIQFLLDGLGTTQGLNVRSLSTFKLAKECTSTDSRMYLRAHNLLPTILNCLSNAPLHQTLGLNTACLLFMLARDSLGSDLETAISPLLADLARLSSACNQTSGASSKQHERMVAQIKALLKSSRVSPGNSLSEFELTPRLLALETCIAILSKPSRSSFRCELRVGGLLGDVASSLKAALAILESDVSPLYPC